MELIEKNTTLLFDSIIESNYSGVEESLIQIINFLERRMKNTGLNLEIISIPRMVKIFMSLNSLLTSPFETRTIEKNIISKKTTFKEGMEKTTFGEIFTTCIKVEDWHKRTLKNILYTCDFHEESLFCHLIMSSVASVCNLLMQVPQITDQYAKFIAGLSLLHDIGKPATIDTSVLTLGDKTKRVTKFPSHGLVGGLILQKSYSDSFGFTLDEWDDLCRCVTIHMCGYHCTDFTNPVTLSKWFRLSLEKSSVKNALYWLSIGDNFGTIRSDELSKDNELFSSRKEFASFVGIDLSYGTGKDLSFEPIHESHSLDENKIFTKLQTSGLVIVVFGSPSAGKTKVVDYLTNYFKEKNINHIYVSRNKIMIDMCSPFLDLDSDELLEVDLKSDVRKSSVISECNKYAQVNNLNKEIDEQIKMQISNAIAFNQVCIVESSTTNRKIFNSYFTDDILNCEILQIYVERNTPHTKSDGDRQGITLEEQIELSGECSIINPLAKMDNSNLSSLACSTENSNMKRDFTNRSQCTLSTSVVWNNMSMDSKLSKELMIENSFGLSHVHQLLEKLCPGLKKGIVEYIDTNSMNVVQYVNYIYGLCECESSLEICAQFKLKFDALCRRFAVQQFVVSIPYVFKNTPYKNRIFSIKYRDGINKLWRSTWARQCRGVYFYVCDDFTCIPIKYQLQRGAELMSGMLVSANIASTQDISDAKKLTCLSDSQQRTCKILLANENDGVIDAHLTEKIDGSLLTITFYYGEIAILIKKIIQEYGDDFSKMILTGFEKFGLVGVVSTQGTFMMGDDMQDYFVTSILESEIIGLSRSFLIEETKIKNVTQIFEQYGEFWFEEMVRILKKLPNYNTDTGKDSITNISLCWESVCALRETLTGNLHTELAISYLKSMCLFLGASWCTNEHVFNIPHTMLNLKEKYEPRFWKTKSAEEVNNLMLGLEDIVYGKLTEVDFFSKFPPSNEEWNMDDPLHPEGYVCYTKEGIFSEGTFYEGKNIPIVDYNKLKLAAYYVGHKFHDNSIGELYQLSKTAKDIFPMAKKVGDFCSSVKHNFYKIAQKISKEFDSGLDFSSKLDPKASKTYSLASREVKIKMIVNGKNELFDEWIRNLVAEHYPLINTTKFDSQQVKSFLKKMCMDLKPWCNYEIEYCKEFQEIIDNPINFSGITSVFLMIMNQL
jgi:hypothetical protein